MMSMRLTNNAIGMPFEAFHWERIQIPLVVNQHLRMGERDAVHHRRPSTELKFALKYYDHRDRRAVNRLLAALEEVISKKGVNEIVEMDVVPKLQVMLMEEDLRLVFDTLCGVVHAVSKDPKGLFSGELIKEDGLDILLNLMILDEVPGSDRMENAAKEHFGKMIRGNALYIIGYLIGNGFGSRIMDGEMVDLLLERSEDDDPVSRGNALFCLRMSREAGEEFRCDPRKVLSRAMMMLDDPDSMVCEEAVRLIQCILEKDPVQGKNVTGAARRIEELSRSGSLETTRAAEAILYVLKERGWLGG